MSVKVFEAAIRCTVPSCTCECFAPGKSQLRVCGSCKHGWVAHALDKLGYRQNYQMSLQVELVQPNIVFDIASLILYGAQATPIRLKILLDRLFSVLQHEEVLQVLHGFGWTYEDYARGYILQDPNGRVLSKWSVTSRDEELVIIQQFLRFGETRSIAQEIIIQDTKNNSAEQLSRTSKTESEIKKFMERTGSMGTQGYLKIPDSRQILSSRAGMYPFAASLMLSQAVAPQSYSSKDDGQTSEPSSQQASPVALTGSPMGRLQSMHPYNYKTSPSISPSHTAQSSHSSELDMPQNLSIAVAKSPSKVASSLQHMAQSSVSVKPENLSLQQESFTPKCSPDGALNYSLKAEPLREPTQKSREVLRHPSSIYADRKMKHLRKSNNPTKRQWQPSPAFGGTFISPSGKKRVVCTACNKSFCDKGALKIHYSAVHLKEMHKCSVEGCNMMFSSRRSRNRHSANPNPKLHLPQKRKLPDGARMIDDGSASPSGKRPNISPMGSFPSPMALSPGLISSPSDMRSYLSPGFPMSSIHRDRAAEQAYFVDANNRLTMMPSGGAEDTEEMYHDMSEDDGNNMSPLLSSAHVKQEPILRGRSSSKRKSKPTRCAQADDEIFVMSDNEDEPTSADIFEGYQSSPDGAPLNLKTALRESPEERCFSEPPIKHFKIKEEKPDETSEAEDLSLPTRKSCLGEFGNNLDSQKSQEFALQDTCPDRNTFADEAADMNSNPITSLTPTSDNIPDNHVDNQKTDDPNDIEYTDELKENGLSHEDYSNIDIPLDEENPKKCTVCGNVFQNHFDVKTHYRNVHLKLMHTCTVDGCNAAFPSKRSRDRHSINLNLHRKLLSTNDPAGSHDDEEPRYILREDMMERNGGYDKEDGSYTEDIDDEPSKAEHTHSTHNGDQSDGFTSDTDSIHGDFNGVACDTDGGVKCHLCDERFRDNLALKEHIETVHPRETYRCTITGCDKIFSTRKSRNRHSQNDNLHRPVVV